MAKNKKAKPARKNQLSISCGKQIGFPVKTTFPIVGIGASAGGLEAFEDFFSSMDEPIGAAFILVSHLDPNHVSILPELIQKKTTMKVHQVLDNKKVLPNQVYIIPPNKELAILNGTLQLLEINTARPHILLIDTFFRSLAEDQGNMAIGIVLSGTGTDGTLGIRAIKGEGGMVMAQDVESAKFDGMPESAIETGMIDYILPPAKMGKQLLEYVKHMSVKQPSNTESALQKIFVILRSATGHDFSHYKQNTIFRRIERRMHIHQIDAIQDYIRYLQTSENEATILFNELLIGVTCFFRDPEAFLSLKEKYLPEFLADKPDDYQVRIWVPGCSTGEEVYSIAILFQECMEIMKRNFSVQIFGTDLDEKAISFARAGIYPESVFADISLPRLRTFFTKDENHYKIKKSIREIVIFAQQNVIKDPPFTKLDLICCRNLLIYFDQELQKKLLPIFHYSLKPGGLLFLGSSESVTQASDLFSSLDKKWKIFRCQNSFKGVSTVLNFQSTGTIGAITEKISNSKTRKLSNNMNPIKLLKSIIAQSDMSTFVVIDEQCNILYFHGRTGSYLEPAEGEASLNILEMARPGLKSELNKAIRKMKTAQSEVIVKNLHVLEDAGHKINLIVRPLNDLQTEHRALIMVIFEEIAISGSKAISDTTKPKGKVKKEELIKLQEELQNMRESLHTTIEELETANEEQKSTNEELQSTNEELQSTNEELETSKEELQSLNEESGTVNLELQSRIDELETANDDMKNLLDATEIATIFLDIDLNIRRFTSKATELISLTSSDIGRPVSHFTTKLKKTNLAKYAKAVLDDLATREVEVEDTVGSTFRMRLRPYRTTNNVIDGVVIIFDDLSEMKQIVKAKRLAVIVEDSNDAIILHDFSGNISAWNKGAEKMYGYSEAEALSMNILDTLPKEKKKETQLFLSRLKIDDDSLKPFILDRIRRDGTIASVWATFTLLKNQDNSLDAVATTERDLSLLNKDALLKLTGGNHDK